MKKVLSILAVVVMTFGFYSCETESVADEAQLFENANDDDHIDPDDRE
jgi:hypothetical protein